MKNILVTIILIETSPKTKISDKFPEYDVFMIK